MSAAASGKGVVLILPRWQGFFSLVFQAVGQAHLAGKTGRTPVVYFNRHCPYWSDAGYQGVRNAWDYYFEPLSSLSVRELFSEPLEVLEDWKLDDFRARCAGTAIEATSKYPPVIEYKSPLGVYAQRKTVHALLERHLRLKPHVREKLAQAEAETFAGAPLLGVHYRGTEKAHGAGADGVLLRQAHETQGYYLRAMEGYLRKNPTHRIFIATDSQEFLQAAQAKFGDKVVFRPAHRLEKEQEQVGLHFRAETKTQGPLLGEEVLLDALLLSKCRYLIHGVSNVSNAALFFNLRLRHVDLEIRHGHTRVYVRREVLRVLNQRAPRLTAGLEKIYDYLRGS